MKNLHDLLLKESARRQLYRGVHAIMDIDLSSAVTHVFRPFRAAIRAAHHDTTDMLLDHIRE